MPKLTGEYFAIRPAIRREATMTDMKLFFLLLIPTIAFANHHDPIPKTGGCPTGYYASGAYCKPTSETSSPAIPRVGSCPSGYYSSGNYCMQSGPGPAAIPRVGSNCPAGYYATGAYCKSSR